MKHQKSGFTLIELSIVLVIIGLIVGGVLVGRDLIAAAEIRAQISQIEKYNTAVNTFKLKYGYLPGDIPEPHASGLGFAARGSYAGQGDGNAMLEGVCINAAGQNYGVRQCAGETVVLWRDLSGAQLIAENFTMASSTVPYSINTASTNPALNDLYPSAVIRPGAYIYVYSGDSPTGGAYFQNGINYLDFPLYRKIIVLYPVLL